MKTISLAAILFPITFVLISLFLRNHIRSNVIEKKSIMVQMKITYEPIFLVDSLEFMNPPNEILIE